MKHNFLIAVLFFGSLVWAQELQITLYGSYVFDDGFDSYYDVNDFYDGKIKGGLQWGVGYEYLFRPQLGIEILYLRQDTEAPTRFSDGLFTEIQEADFDFGINYLMLGGVHHLLKPNAPFEAYGGILAGLAFGKITNPDNGNDSNFTKFSWGLKIGGVYWSTSQLGIKIQAQLLSAVQAAGAGLYFGPSGPSTGLNTYSSIFQFSLGGGLVYRLY